MLLKICKVKQTDDALWNSAHYSVRGSAWNIIRMPVQGSVKDTVERPIRVSLIMIDNT